jgi:MFS family permease
MLQVLTLGLVSFFADFQSEIIFPLLPLFITGELGLSAAFLGLVEGAADAAAALLKYVSGYVADRAGHHKWLMLFGYALSALSKPLLAFAYTGAPVLALRVSDRMGKGIRRSPRDALLAGYVPERVRARAFSLHRALDSAGAVVGVLTLFLLLNYTDLSTRGIFKWTIIPGVAVAVVIIAFVRPAAKPRALAPLRIFERAAAAPWWPFLICHAVYSFGMLSYAFYILRACELGVPRAHIPLVYLVFTVGQVIWPLPLGWLADRTSPLPVLAATYIFQAGVLAAAALLDAAWTVWPLFFLYSLYYQSFMALAPAFVANVVAPARRGAALGLLHMTSGLAVLPGSVVAGLIWDRGTGAATFFFGAACAAAAGAGIFAYHFTRGRRALKTADENA